MKSELKKIDNKFYRVSRVAKVIITSCFIKASGPSDAVREFESLTNCNELLSNAAGEGNMITSLEWAGINDGCNVDIINEDNMEVERTINLTEDEIDFICKMPKGFFS